MVAYRKDGHEYLLVANSSRGVMRLALDHLETYPSLTTRPPNVGIPHKRVPEWTRVH
jgi:hypothetical protein